MKTVSSDLLALLATRQFYVADLWTITVSSGQVLRFTTADADVVAGGHTFLAASHLFSRGKIIQKIGFEVDTLDVDIYPNASDLVNGLPFLQAVRRGYFDAAEVLLERVFMATFRDVSAGTIIIFAGRMGDIEAGRSTAHVTVNSHLELLNGKIPRGVYQAGCPFTLYDSRCGVMRASYEQATTVGAAATQSSVPVPALGQADGWASHGVLTFTSGACSGLTRTINNHVSGVLYIYPPLPEVPALGDGVLVAPGCDKTWPVQTVYALPQVLPSASPYHVTPSPAATMDNGVTALVTTSVTENTYDEWGNPTGTITYDVTNTVTFAKVSGTPASHQYAFAAGVYTFAAADAGLSATINYTSITGAGCGKFANSPAFGGQPFIPTPSTTT